MSRLCLTCRRPDPKPSPAQRALLERFAAGAVVVMSGPYGGVATLDGKVLRASYYAALDLGWITRGGGLTPAGRAAHARWP